jgi:hypothetical protein
MGMIEGFRNAYEYLFIGAMGTCDKHVMYSIVIILKKNYLKYLNEKKRIMYGKSEIFLHVV